MIRLILSFVKTILFSALILVLGHVIQWNGTSLSERIGNQIDNAQSGLILKDLKKWSNQVMNKINNSQKNIQAKAKKQVDEIKTSQSDHDTISESERKKLRSLIENINQD